MFKVNSVISFLRYPHAPHTILPHHIHTHQKKKALHIKSEDIMFDHHGWRDSLCSLIGAIISSLLLLCIKE